MQTVQTKKYTLHSLDSDPKYFDTLKEVRDYLQSFFMEEETKVVLHGNSDYRYFLSWEIFRTKPFEEHDMEVKN